MKKTGNLSLAFPQAMDVDWGRLLDQQLKQWHGGRTHVRGIAEYISNADDSYIRQGLSNKSIEVQVLSKTGKKISKLIVQDYAEGMSKEDLENKFFQYYKSFSGRETAVKDGFEHKAWFSYDKENMKPIYGYDKGGYYYKSVKKENGTTIELIDSIKNHIALEDLLIMLSSNSRIRGTIKNQEVQIKIDKKGDIFSDKLDYEGVSIKNADRNWQFEIPKSLKNDTSSNILNLYYFNKPLKGSQNIIEVSDGKTLFIDLNTSEFDDRPFSKYIYGEVIFEQLYYADAVKENRKGLEEGNDLTIEINEFLSKSIKLVIQEIQELQREKEKNRIIEVSQKKITELNKFLRKCDLNFKKELNQLRKKNEIKNRWRKS
ncbi:hypothetical protein [Salegentibacter salegens]|uniref:Uncharacterized protein n=1 Tax=Salegentibacter salegens TaxID=143223 RepID=A0A1M7L8C8_9FLAO|nr:hypothetical protein [Salegentibacter salegens]PRX40778.1 hypothetical protein LY58_03107 [Salegentibacter salegens]SHM74263.1 hypothetical protein SAMN05878281_1794 [Salegentibacter salegens]